MGQHLSVKSINHANALHISNYYIITIYQCCQFNR